MRHTDATNQYVQNCYLKMKIGKRLQRRTGDYRASVGKSRETEPCEIMFRRFALYQARHHPARARTYAETVAAETRGQVQTRVIRYGVHDRHEIRRRVDHACPGLFDTRLSQYRQAFSQAFLNLFQRPRAWRWVEYTGALKRCCLVGLPFTCREQAFQQAITNPEPDPIPGLPQGRQVFQAITKTVIADEVFQVIPEGQGITAVLAPPERKPVGARTTRKHLRSRLCPGDGAAYQELRQGNTQVRQKYR